MHNPRWDDSQYSDEFYSRHFKRVVCLVAYVVGSAFTLHYLILSLDTLRPVDLRSLATIPSSHEVPTGQRNLAIVLPVDGPSTELCKVISSIVALGYPTPTIVNWRSDDVIAGDDESLPSHLRKITGVLDFLTWTTSDTASGPNSLSDDDLVLVIDAHDVWLQLPPSILIRRYFAINAEADQRLAEEEPASGNIYGIFTDAWLSKTAYRRPRYLNSGSFMGPAGDLRRYFGRVEERMRQHLESPSDGELAGDQAIFAEVFGEQEIWRDDAYSHSATRELDGKPDDEFEYHVGLDYFQQLFYPTCGSENSGSFVRVQDTSSVKQVSVRVGVAPQRLHNLPNDIGNTPPPLSDLTDSTPWDVVPLFADLWTTSIPVGIHHNAFAHGLKARQKTWWDKTWYFPYLRDLLEMRMSANASSEGVATIDAADGGNLEVLPYQGRDGFEAAVLFDQRNGEWRRASWNEVCKAVDGEEAWWDEVLRDAKGSL